MTFAEFQKQAEELLKDSGDSICVSVESWRHLSIGETVEFIVWSAGYNQHFKGPNPEAALGKIRAHLNSKKASLESVGEIKPAEPVTNQGE